MPDNFGLLDQRDGALDHLDVALVQLRGHVLADGLLHAFAVHAIGALAQLADCYGRLVQRTPVDTGRARAGWHIEGEENEWRPDLGEYEKAKGEAAAIISQEVLKLEDLSKADVIYIMNNVEYILPLEAGWSRQSSGFWALFLSELSSQLEKAAERSRRGNP